MDVATVIAGGSAAGGGPAWLDRGDAVHPDRPAATPDTVGRRPAPPGLAARFWSSLPEAAPAMAVDEAAPSSGPPWTTGDDPWTQYLPEVIDEAVAAAQQMVWQVIRDAC